MDTQNQIVLMSLDHSYYDYDYKEVEKKREKDYKPKSNEEMQNILSKRFGFLTKMTGPQHATAEDIQRIAMSGKEQL